MKFNLNLGRRHFRCMTLLAAGVAACLFGPAAARADLIVSVQSVIATAGSSANGIDVELTNSGPVAVSIGGFSFGISVANSDISFTDANTSTAAPYIFGADSLLGPDLTGPTSGESLSASDLFSIPGSGATLGAGSTVGLGHVLFDVSAGAAGGSFPVDLASLPSTALSDPDGEPVAIDHLASGSITISSAAVPEPGSLLMFASGIAALAVTLARRKSTRSLVDLR